MTMQQAESNQRMAMDVYAAHVRTILLAKAYGSTKIKIDIGILHGTDADKMWNIIKAQLIKKKLFKEMRGFTWPHGRSVADSIGQLGRVRPEPQASTGQPGTVSVGLCPRLYQSEAQVSWWLAVRSS